MSASRHRSCCDCAQIDRENKWVSAIVVKRKGVDAYAIEAIGKEIGNSGFNRVIIKSDQEATIKA